MLATLVKIQAIALNKEISKHPRIRFAFFRSSNAYQSHSVRIKWIFGDVITIQQLTIDAMLKQGKMPCVAPVITDVVLVVKQYNLLRCWT